MLTVYYTMSQVVHFCTSIRILKSEFRILNSEFRILKYEFRISKKKVVYGNFVFGDATSGSVHGVGQEVVGSKSTSAMLCS